MKGALIFSREQKGVSLIEVIVVVGILAVIGTAVLRALDTNYRAGRTLDEQVTAVNLVTAYVEAIRELPYDHTINPYTSAGDNVIVPPSYNVGIRVSYSSNGEDWTDTYTNQTLQKITVFVLREGGKPVFSLCTFKTEF